MPYLSRVLTLLSRKKSFTRSVFLASSISIFTLSAHASGDYYSNFTEFVPAIDVENDTRNNLIMLLNKNPVLTHSQTALSFDQTEVNCNLLQMNILADFWGAKTPRVCNDYSDNNARVDFYKKLFIDDNTTSESHTTPMQNDNPFAGLPAADQAFMVEYLLPLFSKSEDTYSPYDMYGRSYSYFNDSTISNNLDSLTQFVKAANSAESIPEEIRTILKEARLAIYVEGRDVKIPHFLSSQAFTNLPETGEITEFKHYLIAAKAFYSKDFSGAETYFAQLTDAQNTWIAETAQYMLVRTALNQIAIYANDWHFKPSALNQEFMTKAFDAIQAYQNKYPEGQYLKSATSFARRIYWNSQQYEELATRYQSSLNAYLGSAPSNINDADQINDNLQLIQLIDEIDAKLFEEYADVSAQHPILAFIQVLKDLRQEKPARFEGKQNKEIEAEIELIAKGLEQQGLSNAAHYLRLLIDWRIYQNAGVLAQFPSFDEIKDKLSDPSIFAMQVLRSEILRKINENEALLDVWKTIITSPNITLSQQQYAQLQLAGAYIANQQIEQIFAPQSPITNLYYRSAVLNQTANNDLLREEARNGKNLRERRVALLALFKNHLYQNNFKDMQNDLALLPPIMEADPQNSYPDNYPYELRDFSVRNLTPFQSTGWQQTTEGAGRYTCPDVQTIFKRLAQNDLQDATAALCLGDFLLTHYSYDWLNSIHPELLASGVTSDRTLNRGQLYDAVLENPQATKDEKAYALFRKINCYAHSGYNSCGDKAVEQSERKRWFNKLNKEYSQSIWAQNLKYYW